MVRLAGSKRCTGKVDGIEMPPIRVGHSSSMADAAAVSSTSATMIKRNRFLKPTINEPLPANAEFH